MCFGELAVPAFNQNSIRISVCKHSGNVISDIWLFCCFTIHQQIQQNVTGFETNVIVAKEKSHSTLKLNIFLEIFVKIKIKNI